METKNWKEIVKDVLTWIEQQFVCSTRVCKKMLKASKINNEIKESYEEIGRYLVQELSKNPNDPMYLQTKDKIEKIELLKKELEILDQAVVKIKSESQSSTVI